jgi:uncharacterized protein YggU (UPF0235/DUF167 family)
MANESQNPLFAYVEARIAAWQAVLASLKTALALDPGGQTIEGIDLSSATPQAGDLGQPIDLPEGAFHGKSVPACIELYLSASPMKKKTNKQITDALSEGGVESNASNFGNIVTGALFKLKNDGKILRFKDGWGLSSWYPAHIRAVTPTGSASKRTKKKGKKSGRTKSDKKAIESAPGKGKANERALEFLRSGKKPDYALTEVGGHLGMGARGARLILGKLVKAGKVEKTANDTYRIPIPRLVAQA